MPKIIKLTESDLIRIVKKVLQEQIATPTNIFGNIQNQPIGNEKFIDSNFKERGAVKNAQGKDTFPCLKKLESKKVAGTTPTQYNIAGALYSFFDKGKYTRENRTGKTQGTWKCDTQGFVELDGKQKLGKPFQWKPSPTEEEVRDGKQLLRYGMMGDFVKKVQETLGFTGTALDSKFGGNTLKAVKDFQRKNDLEDDGLVGEKTYAAMFRKPAEKTQSAQPKGSQSVLPQKPTSGVQRTANIPTSTTTSNTTVADTGLDFS
jgi:hypothetical protein